GGGDPPFQRVDLHALGATMGNVGIGLTGLHGRLQIGQVHLGGQSCDVAAGVHLVDALTQVTQAHALIDGELGAELGQHTPHRPVLIVVVLELLQGGQQRVPAALGDADGEHDEEGIQAGLLHHHTVLGEEFGDDAGRYAGGRELAVHVQTGVHDGRLDGVEHVEVL